MWTLVLLNIVAFSLKYTRYRQRGACLSDYKDYNLYYYILYSLA